MFLALAWVQELFDIVSGSSYNAILGNERYEIMFP